MKTIVCSLICYFVMNLGFSQFQHSFGTEKSEMGRSLTQLQKTEKGYLVAGYTSQVVFGSLEATLVKTDLNGNQIWSRVYGGEKGEYFNSVRQVPNFGTIRQPSYVVAGVTDSFGFGSSDALLTGTDSNGVPAFAGVYGGTQRDVANCVQNIKDENGRPSYIFVGETRSYTAFPGNNVYVVKTDSYGNLMKATVIGGEGDQKGLWIEQTKDGGYIITGSTTNYWCEGSAQLANPATDIFVIKLKPDLTIEWNRILGYPKELDPSVRHSNVGTCVKENKNGNYIITGHTNSFGINNSEDAFLLSIDTNGNFMWLNTYGTERTEMGHSLQITNNALGIELYTVVGLQAISSRKALVFQANSTGALQWARYYGDQGSEAGLELVTDDFDKGFAFTGYTTSLGAGGTDIYLVETNGIGESKTVCEKRIELERKRHEPCVTKSAQQIFVDDHSIFDLPVKRIEYKQDLCKEELGVSGSTEKTIDRDTKATLFPNPVQNFLTVQLDEEVTATKISVYTIQGRMVLEKNNITVKGEAVLSTKNLIQGTYIVKIYTDKGETHLMRFVKK